MTMTDTISDIAVISSMSTNIFKIMSITEFTIMASTPTMLSSMISPKFTTDRIKLNVKIMIYMAGRMMNHAKIAKIGPKNEAKNMIAPPRSPTKSPINPNIIAPAIATILPPISTNSDYRDILPSDDTNLSNSFLNTLGADYLDKLFAGELNGGDNEPYVLFSVTWQYVIYRRYNSVDSI